MMLAVALASAIAAAPAQPGDPVRIDTDRGSRVWIEGSSNVHDWSCRATTFDARVSLDTSKAATTDSLADLIRNVTVKVAVRDLKCGNRKMDGDLYAALKATDPANPSFIIAAFEAQPGTATTGVIDTRGSLFVVGIEKSITARITTERLADGSVKASGSVPLRMTDFGVKPPVGLFGLIRSRNEVSVRFELIVRASPTLP
jgi:polyisoprenoid-binding protein YceI